jgi:flagellar FliJ protein
MTNQKKVKEEENKVDQAKERVKKALQERKTYEILKEKAYEAYMEEEKQAETKTVDEIVSFKYKDER